MYTVEKTFEISYSHRLFHLPQGHKCTGLHGHNADVKIKLYSEHLDKNGFILEFSEFHRFKYFLERFDHATIIDPNDIELIDWVKNQNNKHFIMPEHMNASAENMCKVFFDEACELYKNLNLTKIEISFQETVGNTATYSGNFGRN